jgi:hypothetical protein
MVLKTIEWYQKKKDKTENERFDFVKMGEGTTIRFYISNAEGLVFSLTHQFNRSISSISEEKISNNIPL